MYNFILFFVLALREIIYVILSAIVLVSALPLLWIGWVITSIARLSRLAYMFKRGLNFFGTRKAFKYNRYLLRLGIYLALFAGAIIVLLPMFWMILTAFKQPGKALEFKFLPDPVVENTIKTLYATPTDETANVTFEYNTAQYTGKFASPVRVTVAGEFNGWDKNKTPLIFDGQSWSITIPNLKPGSYQYKFVINENDWTPDRLLVPTGDDNSVIPLVPGNNSNKAVAKSTLMDASTVLNGKIDFQIQRPTKELQIRIKGRQDTVTLTKNEAGIFIGQAELKEGEKPQYSILEPQDFWEGLRKIYTYENFVKVAMAQDFPFGKFFLNSLIVASLSGLLTVILCTMGGYAFAKKDFLFKDTLFMMLMSSMMIPGMIFMVPQFAMVSKFGWINSYTGMVVPHLANVFGLYLMRQHISMIPNAFFEAAKIDGAGEWQLFRYVVIPQSMPVMVTLFLMTFIGQWSNFLWQLIVNTPDSDYRTLPVGLALFKGQYAQSWEVIMAGACFSVIPIAILFLIAQRFLIEGMAKGAIKE